MLVIKFGSNWPSRVKMFENHGDIHVSMVGAEESLGFNFFQNHKYSVQLPVSCKIFPLNDVLTVFHIQINQIHR